LLNLEVIWTWHREGAGIDGRALRVVGNASDTSRGPIALTSLFSSTFRNRWLAPDSGQGIAMANSQVLFARASSDFADVGRKTSKIFPTQLRTGKGRPVL